MKTTKGMTAEEYNHTRETILGMTQEDLATAVGRHSGVIARRCRGELPITAEAELSIRFLVAQKRITAKAQREGKRATKL